MSDSEQQTSRITPSTSHSVIPEQFIRTQTEERQLDAEISLITSRLNEIADFKRDPGGKVNAYVDGLIKRRSDLLKRSRPSRPISVDVRASALDSLVSTIGSFLAPWATENLPSMSEGINQTPGTAGTAGTIHTSGLFAGGLGYSASDLRDDGTQSPNTEKWWIHNWTCSVVFPEAPFKGTLYYRFTVETSCQIYHAPAYSGLIQEFVSVGRTADVSAQSPFDPTVIETVGWPVSVNLPRPDLLFFDSVSVPVSGSIAVHTGKSAALGLIYGAIVGLASGYVQIPWANFGTRLTLPPGTPYDGEVFGKVEYRFEPDWWIDAIIQRSAITRRSLG